MTSRFLDDVRQPAIITRGIRQHRQRTNYRAAAAAADVRHIAGLRISRRLCLPPALRARFICFSVTAHVGAVLHFPSKTSHLHTRFILPSPLRRIHTAVARRRCR